MDTQTSFVSTRPNVNISPGSHFFKVTPEPLEVACFGRMPNDSDFTKKSPRLDGCDGRLELCNIHIVFAKWCRKLAWLIKPAAHLATCN